MRHEKLHELQVNIAAVFSIIKLFLIETVMLILMVLGAVDLIGTKLGMDLSSFGTGSSVVSCIEERESFPQ